MFREMLSITSDINNLETIYQAFHRKDAPEKTYANKHRVRCWCAEAARGIRHKNKTKRTEFKDSDTYVNDAILLEAWKIAEW